MSFWGTTKMAVTAAYLAAKRVYLNPSAVVRAADSQARFAQYNLLLAYYLNSNFEDVAAWQNYVGSLGLYQFTRSIYNPTKRVVQFAVGQMYPGVLTPDGLPLPDGTPLAIPLSRDTPPELRLAIAQAWAWGWWIKNLRMAIRFSAITGSALVEAGDFPKKGRVAPVVHWPGRVPEFRLDQFGNLKRYVIEYDSEDPVTRDLFTYRREVDDVTVKTFRDSRPNGFDGAPAEYRHGYGFAPAVWLKHRDEGSDVGAPAITGIGKIDELNSLVSHIHDQVHIEVDAPAILWFKGSLGRLGSQDTAGAATRARGGKLILTGPDGGSKESLAGNLDLAATDTHIARLMNEIEEDHPELKMWKELRSMSAVTGPGAQRMLGDVQSVVADAQAGYDQQFIKLHQMLVAIGGDRARSGAWGRDLTDAQRKFLPFSLDSYARGNLDHSIDPRPLVPETQSEKWAASLARATAATAWQPLLGGSAVLALDQVGFTKEELKAKFIDNAAAIAAEQLLAVSDVPVGQIGPGANPPQQ